MTQKSICSDHTGGGLNIYEGSSFMTPSRTELLCLADIWWPDIESRHLCVVWTFYQVLNTVRVKCGGIIKNGWMIDPLNLATKHDEYLAPSWRKPGVLLTVLTWLPGRYSGGWAHLDAILCHLVSSLQFRSHKVPFLCFVSISSKLRPVPLHQARPLQAQCSGSSITRDISQ